MALAAMQQDHYQNDSHHRQQHPWTSSKAASSSSTSTSRRTPAQKHAPPTPPMSSTFESRRPTLSTDYMHSTTGSARVALPPIAHLDRTLSSMQPLTPPDEGDFANGGGSAPTRLPPILPAYHDQSPSTMPVDDPFVSAPSTSAAGAAPPPKHQLYEIPPPPPASTLPSDFDSSSRAQPHPQHHTRLSQYDVRWDQKHQPQPDQQPQQVQQHLAPMYTTPSNPTPPPPTQAVCVWDSAPGLIDWLDFTRNRSAHFIAEKTCEMICYLWFASSPVTRRSTPSASSSNDNATAGSASGNGAAAGSEQGAMMIMKAGSRDASMSYPSPHHSPSSPSRVAVEGSDASTLLSVPAFATTKTSSKKSLASSPTRSPPSTLQLVATPSFISFMQKLLETTQVSQSVIVLSLHYIYRLKERNHFTPAQRGSEFRIAVAALMMANKFLDDNTYTNKTWSEVSNIDLDEINRMEREFLLGVDFNLYVDKPTYESWLNLLKGLVSAKERDSLSSASASRNSREAASRRRGGDARKRYQPRGASRAYQASPPVYQVPPPPPAPAPAASVQQQQAPPPPAPSSTTYAHVNPTNSYATPTRLPPLSRAVPAAAYYYPHTASSSTTTSTSNNSQFGYHQQPPSQHYQQPQDTQAPVPAPSAGYARVRSISPTPVAYSDVRMEDASATSTSSTYPHPHHHYHQHQQHVPAPLNLINGNGSKRTAEAAFSPTSATFDVTGASRKRPASMCVVIPDGNAPGSTSAGYGATSAGGGGAGTYENSPLEGLGGFSRMSLGMEGSPEKKGRFEVQPSTQSHPQQQLPQHGQEPRQEQTRQTSTMVPSTLVAPYSYQVDSRRRGAQPQELYFYTLVSSPMESSLPAPAPAQATTTRKRGMSATMERQQQHSATHGQAAVEDVEEEMVDDEADDDDAESVVEIDAEEWSRAQEEERDAHGERRRTRKARLMRWSAGPSSAGAAPGAGALGVGGSAGQGYAYEYSRAWSAHRQMQQQQVPATSTSTSTTTAAVPTTYDAHAHHAQHGQYHHHYSYAPTTSNTLPPLVHPVPRATAAYVPTVVQSANTSPAGGYALAQPTSTSTSAVVQGYQEAPARVESSGYSTSGYPSRTSTSTHSQAQAPSYHAYEYDAAQQYRQQQRATRSGTQGHAYHAHRHQASGAGQWYTHNQGGSVSYHPSPVQEKAEVLPTVVVAAPPSAHVHYQQEQQATRAQESGYATAPYQSQGYEQQRRETLPNAHDGVWARPAAVVAVASQRREEEEMQERGRTGHPAQGQTHLQPYGQQGQQQSRSGSRCSALSEGASSASTSSSEGTEGDAAHGRGESAIPSAPFANAGPAGVHVPFGSEYARYQGAVYCDAYGVGHGYHSHAHHSQPYSKHQHGQQQQQGQAKEYQPRDVYSATGQYPGGSVFGVPYGQGAVKGGQPRYGEY